MGGARGGGPAGVAEGREGGARALRRDVTKLGRTHETLVEADQPRLPVVVENQNRLNHLRPPRFFSAGSSHKASPSVAARPLPLGAPGNEARGNVPPRSRARARRVRLPRTAGSAEGSARPGRHLGWRRLASPGPARARTGTSAARPDGTLAAESPGGARRKSRCPTQKLPAAAALPGDRAAGASPSRRPREDVQVLLFPSHSQDGSQCAGAGSSSHCPLRGTLSSFSFFHSR